MKTLVIVPVLALAAWFANPMAEQNLAQSVFHKGVFPRIGA